MGLTRAIRAPMRCVCFGFASGLLCVFAPVPPPRFARVPPLRSRFAALPVGVFFFPARVGRSGAHFSRPHLATARTSARYFPLSPPCFAVPPLRSATLRCPWGHNRPYSLWWSWWGAVASHSRFARKCERVPRPSPPPVLRVAACLLRVYKNENAASLRSACFSFVKSTLHFTLFRAIAPLVLRF